jgi:hypothetical protein
MRIHLWAVAVLVVACGAKEDPELTKATADTHQALEGASAARRALEIFGVLPNYSCGPISGAIGKAIPPLTVPLSCVTLTTRGDDLDLSFASDGCMIAGHVLSGTLGFEVSVGADRVEVTADFRNLLVDGQALPVKIGAGVCGDEKQIWASVDGLMVAGQLFRLDAKLAYRAGIPLIGHPELTLNGTGSLEQPPGKTEVAAEGLQYEVGAMLPKAGRLTLDRTDGSHVSVRFTEVLWKLGKAEVQVGERAPVEVPILN